VQHSSIRNSIFFERWLGFVFLLLVYSEISYSVPPVAGANCKIQNELDPRLGKVCQKNSEILKRKKEEYETLLKKKNESMQKSTAALAAKDQPTEAAIQNAQRMFSSIAKEQDGIITQIEEKRKELNEVSNANETNIGMLKKYRTDTDQEIQKRIQQLALEKKQLTEMQSSRDVNLASSIQEKQKRIAFMETQLGEGKKKLTQIESAISAEAEGKKQSDLLVQKFKVSQSELKESSAKMKSYNARLSGVSLENHEKDLTAQKKLTEEVRVEKAKLDEMSKLEGAGRKEELSGSKASTASKEGVKTALSEARAAEKQDANELGSSLEGSSKEGNALDSPQGKLMSEGEKRAKEGKTESYFQEMEGKTPEQLHAEQSLGTAKASVEANKKALEEIGGEKGLAKKLEESSKVYNNLEDEISGAPASEAALLKETQDKWKAQYEKDCQNRAVCTALSTYGIKSEMQIEKTCVGGAVCGDLKPSPLGADAIPIPVGETVIKDPRMANDLANDVKQADFAKRASSRLEEVNSETMRSAEVVKRKADESALNRKKEAEWSQKLEQNDFCKSNPAAWNCLATTSEKLHAADRAATAEGKMILADPISAGNVKALAKDERVAQKMDANLKSSIISENAADQNSLALGFVPGVGSGIDVLRAEEKKDFAQAAIGRLGGGSDLATDHLLAAESESRMAKGMMVADVALSATGAGAIGKSSAKATAIVDDAAETAHRATNAPLSNPAKSSFSQIDSLSKNEITKLDTTAEDLRFQQQLKKQNLATQSSYDAAESARNNQLLSNYEKEVDPPAVYKGRTTESSQIGSSGKVAISDDLQAEMKIQRQIKPNTVESADSIDRVENVRNQQILKSSEENLKKGDTPNNNFVSAPKEKVQENFLSKEDPMEEMRIQRQLSQNSQKEIDSFDRVEDLRNQQRLKNYDQNSVPTSPERKSATISLDESLSTTRMAKSATEDVNVQSQLGKSVPDREKISRSNVNENSKLANSGFPPAETVRQNAPQSTLGSNQSSPPQRIFDGSPDRIQSRTNVSQSPQRRESLPSQSNLKMNTGSSNDLPTPSKPKLEEVGYQEAVAATGSKKIDSGETRSFVTGKKSESSRNELGDEITKNESTGSRLESQENSIASPGVKPTSSAGDTIRENAIPNQSPKTAVAQEYSYDLTKGSNSKYIGKSADSEWKFDNTVVYDKKARIAQRNKEFREITDADNAAYVAKAKKANSELSSKEEIFVDVENAVLKELNDKVVKDKDLVTAITNVHKEVVWNQVQKNPVLKSALKEKYSDFKSMRFSFVPKQTAANSKGISKEIEREFSKVLDESNRRFGEYVQSLAQEGKWNDLGTSLSANQRNWFHGGIGRSPDEAGLAARYSRTILDESGYARARSFREAEGALEIASKNVETRMDSLSGKLSKIDGMTVKTSQGNSSLSAELIETVKKAPSIAGKSRVESVREGINKKFRANLSTSETNSIIETIDEADRFSPGILMEKRVVTDLSKRNSGIVSADFKGQNAANLEKVVGAIMDTRGKPMPVKTRAVRKGEEIETMTLENKKKAFRDTVRAVFPEEKNIDDFIFFSGDDGIFLPAQKLTPAVERKFIQEWLKRGKAKDIRQTFVGTHYQDSRKVVPVEKRSELVVAAESFEKNLRSDLTGKIPREELNELQITVRMQPTESGSHQMQVLLAKAGGQGVSDETMNVVKSSASEIGKGRTAVQALNRKPSKIVDGSSSVQGGRNPASAYQESIDEVADEMHKKWQESARRAGRTERYKPVLEGKEAIVTSPDSTLAKITEDLGVSSERRVFYREKVYAKSDNRFSSPLAERRSDEFGSENFYKSDGSPLDFSEYYRMAKSAENKSILEEDILNIPNRHLKGLNNQKENIDGAKAAWDSAEKYLDEIKSGGDPRAALEDALEDVHTQWLKRNSWQADNPDYKGAWKNLSPAMKIADLDPLEEALKVRAKASDSAKATLNYVSELRRELISDQKFLAIKSDARVKPYLKSLESNLGKETSDDLLWVLAHSDSQVQERLIPKLAKVKKADAKRISNELKKSTGCPVRR
jgi:hypothetical protein